MDTTTLSLKDRALAAFYAWKKEADEEAARKEQEYRERVEREFLVAFRIAYGQDVSQPQFIHTRENGKPVCYVKSADLPGIELFKEETTQGHCMKVRFWVGGNAKIAVANSLVDLGRVLDALAES